ncbi:MAG: hypothetical protein QM537_08625 [Candidatus Symbiobacter sp.]|nr:hypothetical protein [Candidatus Symbiobacter sp.]
MTPLAYALMGFSIFVLSFTLFIDHVDKKNHERRKLEKGQS